jgi:hypothetical protein
MAGLSDESAELGGVDEGLNNKGIYKIFIMYNFFLILFNVYFQFLFEFKSIFLILWYFQMETCSVAFKKQLLCGL